MNKDEIITELHKIREQHAAQFGYDISKIYDDIKAKELELGKKTVRIPLRKKSKTGEIET